MTMIPISQICPPAWNSRVPKTGKLAKLESEKIQSLSESLLSEGQLTAIEVTALAIEPGQPPKYELTFGSRRLAAAKLAGWKEINAEVRAQSDANSKVIRNITENAERVDLTPFELARAAAQLRDLGLKNNELAPKLGVSAPRASSLHNLYKGLPAPVLKEWEHGNPVATEKTLTEVNDKNKDDEGKLRAWDEKVADAAAEEAKTGKKPGKRGKAKGGSAGLPVSQKRLGYVLTALSSKSGSPELEDGVRKWGKALLDFVTSGRESPPAGVPKIAGKGDEE